MAREEEGGRSEDPGLSDRDPADEPASARGLTAPRTDNTDSMHR